MLNQFSLAEIVSYGVMAILIARAIVHRAEARSLASRLRAAKTELREIADYLRNNGPRARGLAMARQAVEELALADVFQFAGWTGDFWIIKTQVDEAVCAEFESLYDACEQNELAGPRWGLLFTSLGIVLALMSVSRGTGSPANFDLNSVALAMVNTGLGLGVAIIERSTLARHVISLANELREISTKILIEAARQIDVRHVEGEVAHVA